MPMTVPYVKKRMTLILTQVTRLLNEDYNLLECDAV
jgi:hypothetical protein